MGFTQTPQALHHAFYSFYERSCALSNVPSELCFVELKIDIYHRNRFSLSMLKVWQLYLTSFVEDYLDIALIRLGKFFSLRQIV